MTYSHNQHPNRKIPKESGSKQEGYGKYCRKYGNGASVKVLVRKISGILI